MDVDSGYVVFVLFSPICELIKINFHRVFCFFDF